MFAVSRKPISTTGKFVIKNDYKDAKPKLEVDSQKSPEEPNNRNFLENSKSSIYSPMSIVSKELSTAVSSSGEKKEIKRIKFRLSTIKDVPYSQKAGLSLPESHVEKKSFKKTKEMKLKHKRINREGSFNCGRWQPEEHERFIEAIMRYGNEWKSVQKHVGTRSSTQARSHAQKFFVKIKKTNLLDFNVDLSKNSIKSLHEIANSMNAEEYCNAVKTLNCVAFERKNNPKRRHKKEENLNDSSDIFAETPNSLNINNDDIFSLNTNDNTLFTSKVNSEIGFNLSSLRDSKSLNSFLSSATSSTKDNVSNYQIKIIHNEMKEEPQQPKKKQKQEKGGNVNTCNTIIINNNINTYNYNVSINNYTNCTETKENHKNESMLRKRNRMNSFEGLLNLFPELSRECGFNTSFNHHNLKKAFDESEYVDNFNFTFKNSKTDFEVGKDLEDLMMLPYSENLTNSFNQLNNADKQLFSSNFKESFQNEHNFVFEDLMMMDLKYDKKVT